jgi:hypothetical protein
MKNIIFLIDAQKGASGGGKVIYQYSSFIDSLKSFNSSVAHLEKKKIDKWLHSLNKKINYKKKTISGWDIRELKVRKNHKFSWFNQKIKIKNDLSFNTKNDFVILPEIFAHFAEKLLFKKKIPYAIFVQNGYAIFPTNDMKTLNKCYNNAKFILSYSKDIRECISLAYPKIKNKIFDIKYSIDSKKFNLNIKKENLITYMPRKLPKHSELVISFLKHSLPKKWQIVAIDNLNESQVYKILERSKIFLAFSELEGLPLPPIEAALAGNKVIGYSGEGGREYWKKPIFSEVKTGELKDFCKKIMTNLSNKNFKKKANVQRKIIAKNFSVKNEKEYIKKFLKLI